MIKNKINLNWKEVEITFFNSKDGHYFLNAAELKAKGFDKISIKDLKDTWLDNPQKKYLLKVGEGLDIEPFWVSSKNMDLKWSKFTKTDYRTNHNKFYKKQKNNRPLNLLYAYPHIKEIKLINKYKKYLLGIQLGKYYNVRPPEKKDQKLKGDRSMSYYNHVFEFGSWQLVFNKDLHKYDINEGAYRVRFILKHKKVTD